MKKLISDAESIVGRHESHSRDELVQALDKAIASLPESSRASAYFEIDIENYPYDQSDYPKLFIKYQRPETDVEEAARQASDAQRLAECELREQAEFARLQAKFANKKQ